MTDLLFDTPYWLLAALLVLGAGLWVAGNNRRNRNLQTAGFAAIGLLLALVLLSYFIDTDRETVIKRTRGIVESVEKKDRAAADKLLHPRVRLGDMNRESILARIPTAVDQFNIKGINITSLEVKPAGENMIASLGATANLESNIYSGGVPSTWELVWEKTDSGWLLREIKPLSVPTMDAQSLLSRLKGIVGKQ